MCAKLRSVEELARFEVVVELGKGQVEAEVSADVVRERMTVEEAEQATAEAVGRFLSMIRVEETEIIPETISIQMGLGPLNGPVADGEKPLRLEGNWPAVAGE